MYVKFKAALSVTVAVSALTFALVSTPAWAAPTSYTTPNVITTAGSSQLVFGGQTFVNQGLQGMARLPSNTRDFNGDTFGAFSSMALNLSTWRKTATGYSGNLFALPDRGPNDPANQSFSDYPGRLNAFSLTFTPYTGTANLPAATTSQNQLVLTSTGGFMLKDFNGNGTTGKDPGVGAASIITQNGITLPGQTTGASAGKISLDAEGLAFLSDGTFYVSDEYGANVYYFDATGKLTGVIKPPAAILPRDANGVSYSSLVDGISGRRVNQGLEGMAITPDGKRLVTLAQSATLQDSTSSQQTRTNTRLMIYDISTTRTPTAPVAHYVLQLPILTQNGGGGAANRTAAQSEILALNGTQFLVLSRDGNGLGTGSTNNPVFKSVLLVDVASATNIAGTSFETSATPVAPGGNLVSTVTPVQQIELVNVLNTTQLTKFGENIVNTPATRLTLSEKLEGMALAPVLDENAPQDFFLFVGNDNDFISTDCIAAGVNCSGTIDNDATVLVYRLTLPTYVDPQYLAALNLGGKVMVEMADQTAKAVGETNTGSIIAQLDMQRRSGIKPEGLNAWVQGSYTHDDWDNFSGTGLNATREGFRGTFGADYALGEGFIAGLAVGYGQQDGRSQPGVNVDADGYSFSGYARVLRDAFYAQMGFSLGHVDLDKITRPGAYGLTGLGHTSGNTKSYFAEAGFTLDADKLKIGPKIGYYGNVVNLHGYTETGAAGGNIVVPDHTYESSTFALGGEAYADMGGFMPFAHVSYNWQLQNVPRDISLRLSSAQNAMGTATVTLLSDEDFVEAGVGVQGVMRTVGWNLGYAAQFGMHDRFSHVVRAGVTIPF